MLYTKKNMNAVSFLFIISLFLTVTLLFFYQIFFITFSILLQPVSCNVAALHRWKYSISWIHTMPNNLLQLAKLQPFFIFHTESCVFHQQPQLCWICNYVDKFLSDCGFGLCFISFSLFLLVFIPYINFAFHPFQKLIKAICDIFTLKWWVLHHSLF